MESKNQKIANPSFPAHSMHKNGLILMKLYMIRENCKLFLPTQGSISLFY